MREPRCYVRAPMRCSIATFVLLAVGSTGCCCTWFGSQESGESESPASAELRADCASRRAQWRERVSAALAAPVPQGGACPIALPWPDPGPGPRNVDEAMRSPEGLATFARRMRDLSFRVDRMDVVERSSYDGYTPPLVRTSLARLSTSPDQVRANDWWDFDLVLFVESRQEARRGDGEFVPGRIRGRAVLYDYRRNAVVCASAVDATNSAELSTRTLVRRDRFGGGSSEISDNFALEARRDLEDNALEQAVENLHPMDGE